MFLVDTLLVLAMLFFLFLPMTDRRTVRMRLCIICTLLAVLSLSITRKPVVPVSLASMASPSETVRVPPMHTGDPTSGFSPRPTSDMRLVHGQGNF